MHIVELDNMYKNSFQLLFVRRYNSLPHPYLLPIKTQSSIEFQILEYCKNGFLFEALRLLNSDASNKISTTSIIFAVLLQTCTKVNSFNHGLQIHSHVIKAGLDTDRYVGNSLLALYFKLASNFAETRRVFDGLHMKDVVSWTSIISGYVRAGKPRISLDFFLEMMDIGVEPNAFTLSAMIKASSDLRDVNLGRYFHGVVFKRGFDSNHVIASALIDMYGRNYGLDSARQLFEELREPDTICWTSIISVLTRNDLFEESLGLFYLMQRKDGLTPDGFTFGTILSACGNLGRLKQGKEVHAKAFISGICGNVVVESSIVDMYAKCGRVDESRRVFDRMARRNSVSWCALLVGYCLKEDFDTVIELFRAMEDVDLYCFGTVIRACAGLGAVRLGKEVHCQYFRKGGWRDVIVESALVDLYAKCGWIDFAHRMFVQMSVRSLITWNSMVCGFAQNGRGVESLQLFNEMIKVGITPDYITFVGVLFACSHSGFVDQGHKYFFLMTEKYGIQPGLEHYTCMVDLLGRAGQIEEAEDLIKKSDFREEFSLWAALLGACTASTNPTAAERIARKVILLEPNYHLSYVLLANVYKAVGRWNDALKVMKEMKGKGAKKMPGKSWIETNCRPGLSSSAI